MRAPSKKYVLVSAHRWHDKLFQHLSNHIKGDWKRIAAKAEFTLSFLSEYKPDFIFIAHWSHIISADIFEKFTCIVFHMTDLPFGRGGSPLQNLIVRGIDNTKISAIKVNKGIDTGDVYLKKDLPLYGTAEEIFMRASDVIEQMIIEIIQADLKPVPQQGEATIFTRRKPEEGNIAGLDSLDKVYDYIRMLDAEGYPNAFVEIGNFRFEFRRASRKSDNSIIADVRIIQK